MSHIANEEPNTYRWHRREALRQLRLARAAEANQQPQLASIRRSMAIMQLGAADWAREKAKVIDNGYRIAENEYGDPAGCSFPG